MFLQATNEVVTRVPCTTQDEMEAAVSAATKAFQSWSNTSILTRQQIMFKLQHLIRSNMVSNEWLTWAVSLWSYLLFDMLSVYSYLKLWGKQILECVKVTWLCEERTQMGALNTSGLSVLCVTIYVCLCLSCFWSSLIQSLSWVMGSWCCT